MLMHTHTVLVLLILAVRVWHKFILFIVVGQRKAERNGKEDKGSGS